QTTATDIARHEQMISIREQIETGLLVCPQTKTRLAYRNGILKSDAGTEYRITAGGVPILLVDPAKAEEYANASPNMLDEYRDGFNFARAAQSLRSVLRKDYRTKASRRALQKVLDVGVGNHVCLSVGGGPVRVSPNVTNLNISGFKNVDVVADAHLLPYSDSAVDSIYCEAVLEHLKNPATAVEEMFRVLKPEGKVIGVTPFLQRFHGYPSHFQNFTLVGHSLLFEQAGFQILESGTCVGPTYAIVNLVSAY